MKLKVMSLFVFGLVLMVFFASCSNMSNLNISNIGKTKKVASPSFMPQGVDVSFQNAESTMTSSDKLSVTISAQNKGDFSVPANEFSADFVSPSFTLPSGGEATQTISHGLSAATSGIGGMGQLTWSNLNFSGEISGDSTTGTYSVQYRYLYGDNASVGICLVDPKNFYSVTGGCDPKNIDVSNSKSVVALTKVQESELTNGEYVLQFTFKKLDPSLSYYPFVSVSDYLTSITSNVPKQGILVSFGNDIKSVFDASTSYCFFDSGKIGLSDISFKDSGDKIPLVLFNGNSATLSCRFTPKSSLQSTVTGQKIGLKKYINVKTEFVASGQLSGSITVTKQ